MQKTIFPKLRPSFFCWILSEVAFPIFFYKSSYPIRIDFQTSKEEVTLESYKRKFGEQLPREAGGG
jgi:hypothetical protein